MGNDPKGVSTIAGADDNRFQSENQLEGARYKGEHVAKIPKKLVTS
jgi:NAD(P)H dehydrogenase (quinone)